MRRITPALLAIAVIVSNLPLLLHGYANGHDAPLELIRIVEYRQAFTSGQHLPFWAPDLYGGFGSPIFLFYAPLFAALAAGLMSLVGGEGVAAVVVLVAFSALGTIVMWRFVLEVDARNRIGALVAAALFALHPYLLADKWLRNANAEFIALALLPGVFLGAVSRRPRRAFVTTFLSLAAILLAHNITALVATVLAAGIALVVHRSFRAALPVLAAIAAAIAATAFFWFPALMLRSLVRPGDLLIGKFDFHRQFPALLDLFGVGRFFAIGPLSFFLMLGVCVALARLDLQQHPRRVAAALLISAAVPLALMFRVSTPLWETLPLLRFVQFPWRMGGPFAIAIAAAAGVVMPARKGLAALVGALALVSALPNLLAYRAWESRPFTPAGIAAADLRSTYLDEYLPATADGRLVQIRGGAVLDATPGTTVRTRESGRSIEAAVSSPNQAMIVFRRWLFPVWSASIDGAPATIAAAPGGTVGVPVPPGSHEVRLELVEPPERAIGKAISAIALAVLLLIALAAPIRRIPERREQ